MDKQNTILLVEDEAMTAHTLKFQLNEIGYNVIDLATGEEAVNFSIKHRSTINLILMDIEMGQGMDGTEAANKILEKTDIPIVFLSSHTSPGIVKKTGEISSYGYVVKNSGISVIDASIKMALKLYNAKKELEEHKNKLKKSEEKYRRLTENTCFITWEFDISADRWTYISPQAEKILGYKAAEWTNLDFWTKNLHPEDREWAAKYCAECTQKGKDHSFEYRFRKKEGDYAWLFDDVKVEMKDGKPVKMWGSMMDITEQRKTQRLEREVLIANQSAEFKQKFLANMSHEIRTPLTGMLGFADALAETKLNTKQRTYIDNLRQSGENLREIINLILDYSKIESGKVSLKSKVFASKDLFESPKSLFSSICHKEIQLSTSISSKLPKYIKTDQQRLNQILNNLLSNAVKFTGEGKISLIAKPLTPENQTITKTGNEITIKIEVKDTGKGIDNEAQKYLFKPFSQLESGETRTFEGTGLGLSICKELSEMLGGEIGVDSKPGKGSNFWFTFKAIIAEKPLEKETKAKEKEKPGKPVTPLNILLVEDKKVNQMVVTLMLKAQGHQVVIANNGEEALEIFKPGSFDIILMDIQMPLMDGITATNKLKQDYEKLPPIVGLSANAFEGDREKYMKKGMDEYLTKPIKAADFINIINKLGF